MSLQIDLNRGVLMRVHPKTGVNVYMYRDEPGVWLNAYGTPVSKSLAAECGFDVEKYTKAKVKKERMAQAMEVIEKELAHDQTQHKVVKEMGGFKLVDIGGNRFIVEDPDSNNLAPTPLPKDTAEALLVAMNPTPEEVEDTPVAKKAPAKKASK